MKHKIDDIIVSCLERTHLNTHRNDDTCPACLILTFNFQVVLIQ